MPPASETGPGPPDASGTRREAWRAPSVARDYEARRFRSPLQRLKARRDAALVLALLRRAGEVRRVLDLPCGTGRLVPDLAGAGYDVLAADVSLAMLAARGAPARQAPVLGWLQADAARLPLRGGACDAVVCLRFLFHVRRPEVRLAILREMGRAASRAVVGQVRYRWTVKHGLRFARSRLGWRRRYEASNDRRAIAAELRRAGLELLELVPVSRAFSDKALFLARPLRGAPAAPSARP